jgi:hypothetical protein
MFKLHGALSNVRMSGNGGKITFDIPNTDYTELAKIALACQEELITITVETESPEPIGMAQ